MTSENHRQQISWALIPAKYIFSILNGSTPSSSEPLYWDGDIYWATPEDIGSLNGKILLDTRRKITEIGYDNTGTRLAPIGSIILTTRAPVGNLAIAGVSLCTNQGCKTLAPRSDSVNTTYFYYQLLARKEDLSALSTGTTFQELSTSALDSFELWFPPLATQRAIAAYLDRETAKIDAMIDAKTRLLRLLAEKRRALITHAVTRGLDPTAPLRDSGVAWIGPVPAHWDVEFARWLFTLIDVRSSTGKEDLLSVSHLTGVTLRSEKDVNMFMAESLEGYKICQPGDLVINTLWAWMGAMGIASQVGLISPDYHVYRPSSLYDARYLDFLVRMPIFATEVTRYSKGVWSSRLRLYPEEFFEIGLPIPPLTEQVAIIEYLQREIENTDTLGASTQKSIELLHERRAALIAAAVTGQLEVAE
ncbi:restriction endonuclease subunit S [Candidatus Chloroploca sp. Khr17]|uniref:restriction endonuclease subunit S n=1 Tax=Candidatus Chloroploca sp. Khr17 TaxID=2496869 RepID=UPI00101D1BDA|nr:restriction endonuclease subunit S [Candidatus Chloroploca sp. Khr17]